MSEWKKVKLGDCCEITSSKRIFLSDYVPVGIPFYRSKEIAEMQKGETISDQSIRYVFSLVNENLEEKIDSLSKK